MTSTAISRLGNVSTDLAIKAPVRAATVGANLTLSGLQTVDGVALAADDRVLVMDQTDATQNGIWLVSSGSWTRAADADGNRDFVHGTAVYITDGTANADRFGRVTAANPIVIGVSSLTFALVSGVGLGSSAPLNSPAFTGNGSIAGDWAVGGNATVTGTLGTTGDVTVTSTDAGATVGPLVKLFRNSASPAASDLLGAIDYQGKNASATTVSYARILANLLDATAGSEDAELWFRTVNAGTLADRMKLGQGLVIGSATGGDPGAGKINATGYYLNGTLSNPAFTKSFTSSAQTITSAGALTLAHGLGVAPSLIQGRLKCTGAELGYLVGQEVILGDGANDISNSRGISVVSDATNISVRFASAVNPLLIVRADTGVVSALANNSNWQYIVRAWA